MKVDRINLIDIPVYSFAVGVMKTDRLLLSFGLFTFSMGVGLFFFPWLFYLILAVQPLTATTLFMRFFGVLLLLEGFYFIRSRKSADLRVIKTFYLGSTMADFLMAFISLDAAHSGVVNFFGYIFAGLFLVFALVYGSAYLSLRRKTAV